MAAAGYGIMKCHNGCGHYRDLSSGVAILLPVAFGTAPVSQSNNPQEVVADAVQAVLRGDAGWRLVTNAMAWIRYLRNTDPACRQNKVLNDAIWGVGLPSNR